MDSKQDLKVKFEEKLKGILEKPLAVIPLIDMVLFPGLVFPLYVGREKSKNAIDYALSNSQRYVAILTQKFENPEEEISFGNLYEVGTIGVILKMIKDPQNNIQLLVQIHGRIKLDKVEKEENLLLGKFSYLPEKTVTSNQSKKSLALIQRVKKQISEMAILGKAIPPDFLAAIETVEEPGFLADMGATILNIKLEDRQNLLEDLNPIKRLEKVAEYLVKEQEILKLENKIQDNLQKKITETERQYLLREQLKEIKKELGEKDEKQEELENYREKIESSGMSEIAKEEALRELERLSKMPSEASEASVIRTYLDWMIKLPWNELSEEVYDIKKAKRVLNKKHYGLKEVKELILDLIAVRQLKKQGRMETLCFVGPPGVGKTSLGNAIAEALGRKFFRMSLGGIRDEAEIRGHRRTYIGALPGRIIQGLATVGTKNPVFMLDEIDKIGMDFRGDPSAALLEMLDPEQNREFVDNYLGVPFDLSQVMFITTANVLHTIPPALRDRMEIIEFPGYSIPEKIQIAKKYFVPKQIKENGLKKEQIQFEDDVFKIIAESYTGESGVRNLERRIAEICRKVARKIAEGKLEKEVITKDNLKKYLGVPRYIPEIKNKKDEIGVATGLAWTPMGGEIIFVEATLMKGKGSLILTGQLGEVMSESAQAAYSYLRSNIIKLGIVVKDFAQNYDIHIHVPAGAVPKDGPSAGITMATAMLSVLTKRKIKKDVAMTGEISLRGKVLPIGGLKEKLLAAKYAGIEKVILPFKNKIDMEEVPPQIKKGLQIRYVKKVTDVFKEVLD
jgi:ATP-dependent Lon protease